MLGVSNVGLTVLVLKIAYTHAQAAEMSRTQIHVKLTHPGRLLYTPKPVVELANAFLS